MHEWALAESVVEAARLTAKENNMKVITAVTVVLGELQDISEEAVETVFKELTGKDRKLFPAAKIIFETEKCKLKCRSCGNLFGYEKKEKLTHEETEAIHFLPETSKVYLNCPKCKSPDFEILEGRGIYIKEVEGEN